MSVRIAYDDPADPMDPAMEGHAEQLRRIDAEDARRHQAREGLTGAPRTVVPHGEGPSSAGGRPLQTPGAPDTPTPPRARGGVVADPLALLAEVERERELRDSWYERCHDAEAEARRQRMRAEKAEAGAEALRFMVDDLRRKKGMSEQAAAEQLGEAERWRRRAEKAEATLAEIHVALEDAASTPVTHDIDRFIDGRRLTAIEVLMIMRHMGGER